MISIYPVRENIQSSAWLDKKENARFCLPISLSKPIGDSLSNIALGRLVYLTAFAGADGAVTWFDGMPCDRKKLLWLINVKSESSGKKTLIRLTSVGAVEKARTEYYVNFSFFGQGGQLFPVLAYKHNVKCCDSPKKQEDLGGVVRLLPWMNVEWNVLCRNPEERDVTKIFPLRLSEICEIAKTKSSAGLIEKFEVIDGIVSLMSKRILPGGGETYQIDTKLFFSPHTNSWARDFDTTLVKEDGYEGLA